MKRKPKKSCDIFRSRTRIRRRKNKNLTAFQKKVYKAVLSIPRGKTRSYKWIAEKIDFPQAQRAVGQALKRNPYVGIVPCHRVIRSDGLLGGFSMGERKKRMLLKEEGFYPENLDGK